MNSAAQKLLDKMRGRKPAPPAAPAKRAPRQARLTCAELNQAVAAGVAELERGSPSRDALERLYELTDGQDDAALVRLAGAAPVNLEELDAALAEARDPELGLPASTLRTLGKVRALLAQANGKANGHAKAEAPQYLTVSQATALAVELHDLLAWTLAATAAEFSLSSPSGAHLFDLLGRSVNGSPARARLLRKMATFKAADVPRLSQSEYLRFQSAGRWS